jgi:uncharacterized protein (DUF2147 family)
MKKLGLAVVLVLTSSATYAGPVFEIPINGGVARIQLDDNCRQTLCASVSWTEDAKRRREPIKPTASARPEGTALGSPVPLSAPPVTVPQRAERDPTPLAAPAGEPVNPGSATADREPEPTVAPAATAPEQTTAAIAPTAPLPSNRQSATSPVGEWLVEDGMARIRIEECGNNLCGAVSAAKNPKDTDRHNPNPALRNRSVIGMPILLGMKPTKSNRWEGHIYNSQDGRTYTAKISLKNPDTLRVEGCAFGGLFCGGQNWTRVN